MPLLRRQKVKPKQKAQDGRKALQVSYKAVNCKMKVSDTVTVWLGQSVKLRAAEPWRRSRAIASTLGYKAFPSDSFDPYIHQSSD